MSMGTLWAEGDDIFIVKADVEFWACLETPGTKRLTTA